MNLNIVALFAFTALAVRTVRQSVQTRRQEKLKQADALAYARRVAAASMIADLEMASRMAEGVYDGRPLSDIYVDQQFLKIALIEK